MPTHRITDGCSDNIYVFDDEGFVVVERGDASVELTLAQAYELRDAVQGTIDYIEANNKEASDG